MKNRMVYLETALDSISRIKDYTEGFQADEFLSDKKTQDAVIRNIEIIGQALKDYGVDALAEADPSIPWSQVAGMRNVLAHEYLGVDVVLVWEVVVTHLTPLQNSLQQMLTMS